jgi:endogenous inhibitor of DNA gyrase (YacG/DUF329 family)
MRLVKCPTCRTATPWQENPYRPFCSARCRLIDLGAWVEESYRIPGEPIAEQEDSPEMSHSERATRRDT